MTTRPIAPVDGELTARALVTGAVLGGLLSLCNIYSGLRIGWGFNMSITAVLLAWGLWFPITRITGARMFGKLENNLSQAAASAGASIASAGLVSAIPALTMITGQTLSWLELACWTSVIGLTGVLVAIPLRRQMIEIDRLPFAAGIATAETLDKMYASGTEGARKVWALVAAGAFSGALKAMVHFARIGNIALPGSIAIDGARRASLMNLTIALEPSPLMIGVGALGVYAPGCRCSPAGCSRGA